MRVLPREQYEAVRAALDAGMTQRETQQATGVSKSTIEKIAGGYVPQWPEKQRVYKSVAAYFCRGCRTTVCYKPCVICEARR